MHSDESDEYEDDFDSHRKPRPKLFKYKFVSSEKRQKLIQMIEIEKVGIKEASKKLLLNYSTAKSILRKYR